jgi:transcriptional regulator with XRE-family HTH domain
MNTLDIDNITKSAIDRLNKIRTDKHISIAEIARKMGKAESSVKRVLSGDSKNSSVAMLLGIGIALEVEVSDIFKDSEIVAVVNAKENEVATAVAVAETAERIAVANDPANTHVCENCQLLEFYKKQLEAREAWIERLIELSHGNNYHNHRSKRNIK